MWNTQNKIISDVLFKVLRILVRVVTEDIPDCYGKPGTSFQKKLQELISLLQCFKMNKCLFKVAKTTNVYQMGTSSWTNPENSKCKIGDQLGPKGKFF
jgi:hypothetical protein